MLGRSNGRCFRNNKESVSNSRLVRWIQNMEEYSLTDQSLHWLTMYHNVLKQNTILEEASDFQTANMRYYVEIGTFIKIDFGVRVPGTKSLYVYLSTEVCFQYTFDVSTNFTC